MAFLCRSTSPVALIHINRTTNKRLYISCSWNRVGFIENGMAGEPSTVSTLNMTRAKSSTCHKIATASAATSRCLMNCHGITTARSQSCGRILITPRRTAAVLSKQTDFGSVRHASTTRLDQARRQIRRPDQRTLSRTVPRDLRAGAIPLIHPLLVRAP